VNRIPVVSEEQRAEYGAPVTDVSGGAVVFANDGVQPGDPMHGYVAKYEAKKKPASKIKAKNKSK
jgi:hypothetical protein